jgi:hypothetical protein
MSVRVAGLVCVEELEGRRLLSGVGDAVRWDLQTPINAEISRDGEVDYYQFSATAGQKIVFDSVGMKRVAILDSDASTELDHVFIFDGAVNPTPGRLVWEAPHSGTFYVSVAGYRAFLIDVPTGAYSLAAYKVNAEDGPLIAAGQSVSGSFSSGGDIDSYSFDAQAGTIYRFAITSPQAAGVANYVMGVVEAQPWMPQPQQPHDAQEAYPGHNIEFTNLDGQTALGLMAEWVAPASGRYHFSIAPLDAKHAGAYTVVMSQRAFWCDPQADFSASDWALTASSKLLAGGADATSKNTPPKSSSHSLRHRKPRKHHRRPAVDKHAKPSAKEKLQSARQKSLLRARD